MFINYQWGALSTLPLQPPKFEKLEKTSKWIYTSLGYINPKFQILTQSFKYYKTLFWCKQGHSHVSFWLQERLAFSYYKESDLQNRGSAAQKKWSSLWSISSVNVTKTVGNCGFGLVAHIYRHGVLWNLATFIRHIAHETS